MESAEMQDEARNRGWDVQHLTFSDYSVDAVDLQRWHAITGGKLECGDASDGVAIIEIKTLADAMDWKHLETQLHKMSWTGKKCFVVIRDFIGSFYSLKKGAKMDVDAIETNLRNLYLKCIKLGVPVIVTLSIPGTFTMMERLFEKHDEAPSMVNTWYQYKGDVEKIDKIRMIAVVHGIGIVRARVVPDPGAFMDDARKMELEDFQANYRDLPQWGDVTCKRFWEAMQ
jgi:hypothetical protein